jgi:hypothetical protein
MIRALDALAGSKACNVHLQMAGETDTDFAARHALGADSPLHIVACAVFAKKVYTDFRVIILSSQLSMRAMASPEGIETMTFGELLGFGGKRSRPEDPPSCCFFEDVKGHRQEHSELCVCTEGRDSTEY